MEWLRRADVVDCRGLSWQARYTVEVSVFVHSTLYTRHSTLCTPYSTPLHTPHHSTRDSLGTGRIHNTAVVITWFRKGLRDVCSGSRVGAGVLFIAAVSSTHAYSIIIRRGMVTKELCNKHAASTSLKLRRFCRIEHQTCFCAWDAWVI